MAQRSLRLRARLLYLILIMISVVFSVTGTSIWLLYDAAFKEERARLVEAAQSQARLIESVARHGAANSQGAHPGAAAATLSQIVEAHKNYQGFGETGEFTLARREGNQIVFLLSHRHDDLDRPKPVAWQGTLALPMRRALMGLSGTVIGLDYRGVTVLGAHEPVAELDAGIVAKIDLAEVRRPFLQAGAISSAGALIIIILAIYLFCSVSAPIFAYVQAEDKLRVSEARL